MGGPDRLTREIAALARGGGIVATDESGMAGFMLNGYHFAFKGLRARMVPEIGHAARLDPTDPDFTGRVYETMYPAIASAWLDFPLHIIGYLAHDLGIYNRMTQFGFGSILEERLRPLQIATSPETTTSGAFVWETNVSKLVELQAEHAGYYAGSPIFLNKSTSSEDALADLRDLESHGAEFLTYQISGDPVGCFILCDVRNEGEGMLLRHTNTGQLKSAYIKPEYRRTGVGLQMLRRIVHRANERSFDRLFVEHETANVPGSAFWGAHFTPYLRYAMRFVELPGS